MESDSRPKRFRKPQVVDLNGLNSQEESLDNLPKVSDTVSVRELYEILVAEGLIDA